MSSLTAIRKERLGKLERLLRAGRDPYPLASKRTHTARELLEDFAKLAKAKKEVTAAGRIRSLRSHGGAAFLNLQDASGQIQLYIKRDGVGEKAYEFFFDTVDIGDIVQARGTLFLTKRREKTLEVSSSAMLAKAIRPLPEKWHGLKDTEERYRRRYLDLLMSEEAREVFKTRSAVVRASREFLEKNGFMEVETSMLQPIPGGASAKPFKTHLNALDMDLYLRVAPELDLKKLLVGGFEKVYEIGRSFRNEGMDYAHNPEFTSLEFYWAYADYKDLMKLTEKLFLHVFGAAKVASLRHEGRKISLKAPFERLEFTAMLSKYAGIDYESLNRAALALKAKALGVGVESHLTKGQIADIIFKKVCRPKIAKPTFVIHHPAELAPLAKTLPDRPEYSARFQLVIAGWEVVNAFSELNDPVVQKERFTEQEKRLRKGDEEAQRDDPGFVEALEYGMPPAAGFGFGVDRLVALLTGARSLREVILFPTMRQK